MNGAWERVGGARGPLDAGKSTKQKVDKIYHHALTYTYFVYNYVYTCIYNYIYMYI